MKKAIEIFPEEPRLYSHLFSISSDKEKLIQAIADKGFTSPTLLGKVISYYIDSQQWDKISRFVFRIENNNELDEEEKRYLSMIIVMTCFINVVFLK